ncbi:hypothetical protein LLG95_00415 [bacterium]|nr:hypothetical protein [bacterium]
MISKTETLFTKFTKKDHERHEKVSGGCDNEIIREIEDDILYLSESPRFDIVFDAYCNYYSNLSNAKKEAFHEFMGNVILNESEGPFRNATLTVYETNRIEAVDHFVAEYLSANPVTRTKPEYCNKYELLNILLQHGNADGIRIYDLMEKNVKLSNFDRDLHYRKRLVIMATLCVSVDAFVEKAMNYILPRIFWDSPKRKSIVCEVANWIIRYNPDSLERIVKEIEIRDAEKAFVFCRNMYEYVKILSDSVFKAMKKEEIIAKLLELGVQKK